MKDDFETHRLRANNEALQISNKYLWEDRKFLIDEIERYRKEVERLQNLFYDGLANQIFPPVRVETIKMNTGA